MTPIYDNRMIIGYAKTQTQAKRLVLSKLQFIPKGWTVSVKARDTSIIDLPSGWVYSVHP
jgi:hypothetical protein